MTQALIGFDLIDGIAIVTMNRPEARNAINAAMNEALAAAIARIEDSPEIRIGVLCAKGPVFSAGMDLKAFAGGERDRILGGSGGLGGLVRRQRSKPMIAAVGGPAVAGGFELALACDMIVASPLARFGLPEPKRGLIAGAGGIFRLSQRIAPAKAAEIVLTGRSFDCDEADTLGLISRRTLDHDPLDAALALAREIADCAPLSISASLSLMQVVMTGTDPALWRENDRLFGPVAGSQDALEGAVAFAEKRDPIWKGS